MGKGSALSAWQPDAGLLTRLVVLDDGRVEQRSLSNCARSAIEYRNGCGPWAGTKVLEDLTRDGCSARLVTDIIAADFCPRPPRSPRRRRNGNGGACWFIRRCCGRVRARSLRLDPRRLLRKGREPRCRWRRRRSGRSGRRLRRRRLGWLSVSVCPSIDTGIRLGPCSRVSVCLSVHTGVRLCSCVDATASISCARPSVGGSSQTQRKKAELQRAGALAEPRHPEAVAVE
jgi:hypothetical protein